MAVLWRSEAAGDSHVRRAAIGTASTERPGPSMDYTFSAELWQYDGEAPWGFVTLPAELSEDIRAKHGPSATSVGSIKVMVTVGAARWATSLFPARSHRRYVLPIQNSVSALVEK
jgi:hypothetical protein